MIEGINTNSMQSGLTSMSSSSKMTDDQKIAFFEIIEKYDSTEMTPEKMEKLKEELKSAGIKPSEELRELMDKAGFKPQKPPKGSEPLQTSAKASDSVLEEFAEKFRNGSATEDDLNNLFSYIQSNSLNYSGNLVNSNV